MPRPRKRTTAADLDSESALDAQGDAPAVDAGEPDEPPTPPEPAPPPAAAARPRRGGPGSPLGKQRDDGLREYARAPTIDPTELVCLRTWTGVVDGNYRIVRRGAPAATIPQVVLDDMLQGGGQFGYLQPPATAATAEPAVVNLGRGNVRI